MASGGQFPVGRVRHDGLMADLESGRLKTVIYNPEMLLEEEAMVKLLKANITAKPERRRSQEEQTLLSEAEAAPSTYHLVQRLIHGGNLYLVDKGQGLVYSNNLDDPDAEPELLGTWTEEGGVHLKEVVSVSKVKSQGVVYLVDKARGHVYSSSSTAGAEPEEVGRWSTVGGIMLYNQGTLTK